MSPENRRRQYRVDELDRVPLRVQVIQDKRVVEPRLLDVSFNGAGLLFTPNIDLDVPKGDYLFLRFILPDRDDAIQAVAQVTFRATEAEGVRYGVEFTNADHIHQQVPGKLIGLFNRRRAFRIVPGPDEPITATIIRRDENPEIVIPVVSLSVSGAGVFAKTKDLQVLERNEIIIMTFELPGETQVCRFSANVCYGMKWKRGIRYGIQFEDTGSRKFERMQQQVMNYVMIEQRKLLKARADAR